MTNKTVIKKAFHEEQIYFKKNNNELILHDQRTTLINCEVENVLHALKLGVAFGLPDGQYKLDAKQGDFSDDFDPSILVFPNYQESLNMAKEICKHQIKKTYLCFGESDIIYNDELGYGCINSDLLSGISELLGEAFDFDRILACKELKNFYIPVNGEQDKHIFFAGSVANISDVIKYLKI